MRKRTIDLAGDECHVLRGEACGSGWGPRNERTTVPITTVKARQPYSGAVNLVTGWTARWKGTAGTKETPVAFLTDLRQSFQGRRMMILWDGAPYHRAHWVPEYLGRLQGPDSPAPQRHIQVRQFAPSAPTHNPMEDVWLAGNRAVRQHWAQVRSFHDGHTIFSSPILRRPFYFDKLNWYGRDRRLAGRRAQGVRWECMTRNFENDLETLYVLTFGASFWT